MTTKWRFRQKFRLEIRERDHPLAHVREGWAVTWPAPDIQIGADTCSWMPKRSTLRRRTRAPLPTGARATA